MSAQRKDKKNRGKQRVRTLPEEQYQILSWRDCNLENLKNVIRFNPYAWMLVGLIIIGFALRFINLGFNSLWLDEGATLNFAQNSLVGIWEVTAGGEFNPPLFYWMEHLMLLFGDSEFILRFLPALFGWLTIPIIYFIGREISGRLCGIVAAGLLTFSSFHIFYSQDARAYTTMLFLFSLAILFYLIALRSKGLKYWICAGIFAALAFWAHFYVFIGIIILILHALIVKRREIQSNICTILPVITFGLSFVIISLPLIVVAIELFFVRTGSSPTWGLSGFDVVTNTLVLISGSEIYLTIIFTILAILGISYLFIKKEKRNFAYLLLLSLILPFIASMILAQKMPMSPRYLIYLLPFFFTAIGSAFSFIPKEIDYKKVACVILILSCLVSVPYLSTYYTTYSKEDWRGMADTITELTNDGDYVVVLPDYIYLAFDYYYDSGADNTNERYATTSLDLEALESERQSHDAYYIFTWDITAANPEGDALSWIDGNTQYLGQNTGIYVFKSK